VGVAGWEEGERRGRPSSPVTQTDDTGPGRKGYPRRRLKEDPVYCISRLVIPSVTWNSATRPGGNEIDVVRSANEVRIQ
jgi:hypothetical protein